MSKAGDNKKPGTSEGVSSEQCRCAQCKNKVSKFGFCQEHFEMYMAGVLRGDGTKPVDYEKKLERFVASRKAA